MIYTISPISEEERHYIKCLKSIKDAKDTEFNAVLSNSAFSLDDILKGILKSIEVVTLEELQERQIKRIRNKRRKRIQKI